MIPCRPAMMFCSIVGQARAHTAAAIGPSTIDRSNCFCTSECVAMIVDEIEDTPRRAAEDSFDIVGYDGGRPAGFLISGDRQHRLNLLSRRPSAFQPRSSLLHRQRMVRHVVAGHPGDCRGEVAESDRLAAGENVFLPGV